MDKIIIKDLEIFAYHGVLPEEKRQGQNFIVTAELYLDLRDAGMTDELDKTVNYAKVCEDISECMTEEKYDLIEAVAENIAGTILLKYEKIKEVHIIISKPAVTKAIAIPLIPLGILTRLSCSRIPAKTIKARAKPRAVEKA